jgi:hypothetical protein
MWQISAQPSERGAFSFQAWFKIIFESFMSNAEVYGSEVPASYLGPLEPANDARSPVFLKALSQWHRPRYIYKVLSNLVMEFLHLVNSSGKRARFGLRLALSERSQVGVI